MYFDFRGTLPIVPKYDSRKMILENEPIDTHLHCVTMISNPCLFKRRYQLALEFIKRTEKYPNVILYVVEVVYLDKDNKDENGNDKYQPFVVTRADNPRHLQIKTKSAPLWHKESALNIGFSKLLPPDWKAAAWIDADIEFENVKWAEDTLKILNNGKTDRFPAVCQLFTHCNDLNQFNQPMKIFQSFGFRYNQTDEQKVTDMINYWHPGYCFAFNREAFEIMGSLLDFSILGSGDNIMAKAFIGQCKDAFSNDINQGYKDLIYRFQNRVKNKLHIYYTPGVIQHYFHGSKVNRKYNERWKLLVKYQYNPKIHITKDENGLITNTKDFPQELLNDIMEYFRERNEDECFE